jgi:excisionase family DNA binding protein
MPGTPKPGDSNQPKLEELITLEKAAELSGLSPPHLRLLVRSGKIWGKKIGHNWLTTAQAVKEYLARDRRPGPKPTKKNS